MYVCICVYVHVFVCESMYLYVSGGGGFQCWLSVTLPSIWATNTNMTQTTANVVDILSDSFQMLKRTKMKREFLYVVCWMNYTIVKYVEKSPS